MKALCLNDIKVRCFKGKVTLTNYENHEVLLRIFCEEITITFYRNGSVSLLATNPTKQQFNEIIRIRKLLNKGEVKC